MKNVAQKFLPLALVIIVALYGVLAVPPLSNSEIAVAISPSGEGVGNSAAPNSDDIFGFLRNLFNREIWRSKNVYRKCFNHVDEANSVN